MCWNRGLIVRMCTWQIRSRMSKRWPHRGRLTNEKQWLQEKFSFSFSLLKSQPELKALSCFVCFQLYQPHHCCCNNLSVWRIWIISLHSHAFSPLLLFPSSLSLAFLTLFQTQFSHRFSMGAAASHWLSIMFKRLLLTAQWKCIIKKQ